MERYRLSFHNCFFKMNILKENTSYEEKIQKSTFIAHLFPVNTWQEAKEYIALVNNEHKTATHNCWAYIVGNNGETSHSSDAGEPSGTAGKPILSALLKYNLTNTVAIVTRYFGGVKLGVRGLIEAYGGIVESAIINTNLMPLVLKKSYYIITDYDFYNILKYKLNIEGLDIINTEYTDKIVLQVEINENTIPEILPILSEYQNQGKITLTFIS